ncbi:MAG: TnpV protein [Eubacterium sp.]
MKNNKIACRRVGDYNIPNLILPTEEANIRFGKWGMLHKDYLLKHKEVVFMTLLVEGNLWQYLADIDIQAQQMFDAIVEQIKEAEGVTEQLKEENQLEWIGQMNNIQNRVVGIVNSSFINI